jgi:hypothetical protein
MFCSANSLTLSSVSPVSLQSSRTSLSLDTVFGQSSQLPIFTYKSLSPDTVFSQSNQSPIFTYNSLSLDTVFSQSNQSPNFSTTVCHLTLSSASPISLQSSRTTVCHLTLSSASPISLQSSVQQSVTRHCLQPVQSVSNLQYNSLSLNTALDQLKPV